MDISECREEVKLFAVEMEKRLRENDHKPGWENDPFEALFARLLQEAGEVLTDNIGYTGNNPQDEVVDVANFAMMLWDNFRNGG